MSQGDGVCGVNLLEKIRGRKKREGGRDEIRETLELTRIERVGDGETFVETIQLPPIQPLSGLKTRSIIRG